MCLCITAFLAIYVADVGHGFIQDDFGWIRSSATHDLEQFVGLFTENVGFYRPIVSATFAADFALWGLNPFGYGLSNLLICGIVGVLLFGLARRLSLGVPAAVLSAAVWAFNFHGINMALMWVSGRTSLLVSLFALATALMFLGARWLVAGLLCLVALLCKEEAVLLPALLTGFLWSDDSSTGWRSKVRRALLQAWPLWVSLAVYAALRFQSGAMGPFDAPSYYRFSLSPSLVLRNLLEYADRAGTVPLAVAIVLAVAMGRKPFALADPERRALRFAVFWLIGTHAVTVFLPARSSLYAVLPSCGSALAVGAFGSMVHRVRPDRFRHAVTVLLALLIVLIPIYRLRNDRWVELADTSTRVMQVLQFGVVTRPAGGRIVLVDDSSERFNLAATFGGLFPDAVGLFLGDRWMGEITNVLPAVTESILVYRFQAGTIVYYPETAKAVLTESSASTRAQP